MPHTQANPFPAPVVVLTGASSGIGHAAALAFARAGAKLVLAARGPEALDKVAAECALLDAQALAVPTDVTDADAMQALAEAALQRFGRIDVWINNVGIGAIGAFDATPMEAHERVIAANLLGHMNGAHAVLPHFRQRGRGTLINMISSGGWVPAPYAAAYTASKFGLRGFSEALRAELGNLPDVHVCEVYPTFVDTPGLFHGANYTGKRLRPPPPVLDPRTVAKALVALSRTPRNVTAIGSVAIPGRLAHAVAPGLTGRLARWLTDRALERAGPAPVTNGNLFEPSRVHTIDGGHRTLAVRAMPVAAVALAGAVGLGLMWAMRPRRPHSTRRVAKRDRSAR
ncbi:MULTISPECIES: SDR family oxidoreductase [unclassified Polaromonas]|uniref:SDR family oxidoreductase n=1 Tax=unclassified Polaromonas TaxID=2638319 RepID=UPI0018C904E4|nr:MULTISPECIES: SDR family oxidoreductase [unclassified Polaromonas]MBG6071313.1 NAD(P)-dependent dehydrogenase (short-subunit alcohol dehydrogenase family) [Polaromonas sp. CG_9.7]MBG6113314.1 NAD(P)-dependent dehydrogenase (short-subunit alcohol dehydrogenase family) [Polaromonas sp. CG_9.2]MDH6183231.1 NAD(P)-dependent dehydrogenase (short-subunit alcohol dehydrogenase family) [Polaromonas sp. CG_23.6]